MRIVQNAQQPDEIIQNVLPPADQTEKRKTVEVVVFRIGESISSGKIHTVRAGVEVEVISHEPDGWTKVRYNNAEGFMKTESLSTIMIEGGGNVELLDWSEAKDVIRSGAILQVIDVRTGLSFTMKCISKTGHCDVEPLTAADTATILKSRNGVWAWDPRPVWVTVDGRTFAAALNGLPHDVTTIRNNNMNGHLCMHFNNTVTNSKTYQKDLNDAVIEAWNASK